MRVWRPLSRSHPQSVNRTTKRPRPCSLELRDRSWIQGTCLPSREAVCAISTHCTLNDYHGGGHFVDPGLRSVLAIDNNTVTHSPEQHHRLGDENHIEELLQTLCSNEQLPAALDALSRVHIPLSNNVYVCMLKACIKSKSLLHAMHIYSHAAQHRNQLTGLLGDYLVITLAKFGAIEDACRLAHSLLLRTVFTWTALISAYTDCGQGHTALEIYQGMQIEGVQPNDYTFVSLLKACGNIPDLKQGRRLHAAACKKGIELDAFVQNTLVSMYSKCNAIKEAEAVFERLHKQDTTSWNVMISSYVERRKGDKALLLYRQMQEEGMDPDKHTIIFALRACCTLAESQESSGLDEKLVKFLSLELIKALHRDACEQGFILDESLANTLITVYGKCGSMLGAEGVFVSLSSHGLMSWTALLSAYVEQGQGGKALRLYRQMLEEGTSPERHVLVVTLQATSVLDEEEEFTSEYCKPPVKEIREALHGSARQNGFASDVNVVTTLVSLYGKSGEIEEARNAFLGMSWQDMVLWTAMLSAYVEQGQGDKVLQLYVHIQREGMCPDQHVLVISLQACCILAEKETAIVVGEQFIKVRSLDIGKALHSDVCRRGYGANVFVRNALVLMYGKCGDIVQAEEVFRTMPLRDLVSWSAMLSVFVEQGQGDKALLLYRQIQAEKVFVDDRLLLCVLQACSKIGSLETCNQIHFDLFCAKFDTNLFIAASSIHAYGNCASMLDAHAMFDGLPQADVASHTACASGYAGEGESISTMNIFERMLIASIPPNEVTFTAIFLACSHTGFVALALEHFDYMRRECRLSVDLRHYGTLVDLLGRVGDFNKVENLLKRMPLPADLHIWSCLLGACRVHGNVELGRQAFYNAISLQPKDAAAYDLMINIYADAGLEKILY